MTNRDSRRTLLVGGHRKAGTTLAHALCGQVDGVYSPPFDMNVLYSCYPRWTKTNVTDQQLRDRLWRVTVADYARRLIQAGVPTDSPRLEALKLAFAQATHESPPRSVSDLIDLVARLAWAVAPARARIVALKETSLELYLGLVPPQELARFDFVQVVRDPRDNWGAIRAGLQRYEALGDSARTSLDSLLLRVHLGWLASSSSLRESLRTYTLLRFEDIVQNPRDQLVAVSRALGVPDPADGPVHLKTEGSPYVGNGYEDVFLDVPSSKNVGRWRERISDRDARLIEFLLKPMMHSFGYEHDMSRHARSIDEFAEWYANLSQDFLFSDPFGDASSAS